MKERHIELNIKGIIAISLDTIAKAVYVRFTNEKVERTEKKMII